MEEVTGSTPVMPTMKDLFFIDNRHVSVYVVRNPKSRLDAQKRLAAALVPKMFENIDYMEEYVVEAEEFKEIP